MKKALCLLMAVIMILGCGANAFAWGEADYHDPLSKELIISRFNSHSTVAQYATYGASVEATATSAGIRVDVDYGGGPVYELDYAYSAEGASAGIMTGTFAGSATSTDVMAGTVFSMVMADVVETALGYSSGDYMLMLNTGAAESFTLGNDGIEYSSDASGFSFSIDTRRKATEVPLSSIYAKVTDLEPSKDYIKRGSYSGSFGYVMLYSVIDTTNCEYMILVSEKYGLDANAYESVISLLEVMFDSETATAFGTIYDSDFALIGSSDDRFKVEIDPTLDPFYAGIVPDASYKAVKIRVAADAVMVDGSTVWFNGIDYTDDYNMARPYGSPDTVKIAETAAGIRLYLYEVDACASGPEFPAILYNTVKGPYKTIEIVTEGASTLDGGANGYGILSYGSTVIKGDELLDIDAVAGIFSIGDLTFRNACVKADTETECFVSFAGDITIDNSDINLTSDANGIGTWGGDITINDGTVFIEADENVFYPGAIGNITINHSMGYLNFVSGDGYPISYSPVTVNGEPSTRYTYATDTNIEYMVPRDNRGVAEDRFTVSPESCMFLRIERKSAVAEDLGLWVNGKKFTTETNVIPCGSGEGKHEARYDSSTHTLTLENATIDTADPTGYVLIGYNPAVDAPLNVVLIGSNKIVYSSATDCSFAVYSDDDITFSGTGGLSISGDVSSGIYSRKSITFDNVQADVIIGSECESFSGLYCFDDLSLLGCRNITVNSPGCGVSAENIDIESSYLQVTAADFYGVVAMKDMHLQNATLVSNFYGDECYFGPVYVEGDLTAEDTTISAVVLGQDCNCAAIEAWSLTVTNGNGDRIAAGGYTDGIYAAEPVNITGGDVALSGGNYGIYSYDDINLTDVYLTADNAKCNIESAAGAVTVSGSLLDLKGTDGCTGNISASHDLTVSDCKSFMECTGTALVSENGSVTIDFTAGSEAEFKCGTGKVSNKALTLTAPGADVRLDYTTLGGERTDVPDETFCRTMAEAAGADLAAQSYLYIYHEVHPTEGGLWVNGECLSATNTDISCGTGSASYDPATNTLTLDNAVIKTYKDMGAAGEGYIVYDPVSGEGDLKIVIKGNTVIGDENDPMVKYGIYAYDGDLTVEGTDGSLLTVEGNAKTGIYDEKRDVVLTGLDADITTADKGYGVSTARGDVTVSGGSVSIDSGYSCLNAGGKTIIDGADLDLFSNGLYAIQDGNGKGIEIKDSDVDAVAYYYNSGIFSAGGDISVKDSDVYVETKPSTGSMGYYAISTDEKVTVDNSDGNEIKIKTKSSGITGGKVEIKGGTADINAGYEGIYAIGDLTLENTKADIDAANMEGIRTNGTLDIKNSDVDVATEAGENAIKTNDLAVENGSGNKVSVKSNGFGIKIKNGEVYMADGAEMSIDAAGGAFNGKPAFAGNAVFSYDGLTGVSMADAEKASYWTKKTISVKGVAVPGYNYTPRESSGGDGVPIYVGGGKGKYSNLWIEGENQQAKEPTDIGKFWVDVPFAKFKGVAVDGKTLSAGDYSAYEGSTVVELSDAFLETLKEGMHTISIQFTDGTADTTFYIGNEENPNTGAPDMGVAIGALMVIAAAAAVKKH